MAIDKIFDGAVDGIADNLFNSVSNSVSEIKAMQQRKAAENVQLVVQALKKIDADIREKYDGVTETIEKRVANIKDGRDGIDGKNGLDGVNGKDGRDGKDGRNGRDGLTGPRGFDGPKGADGKDGQNGEDGVSITDAHIDFDGSLIISLSSGRVINVGEVVAADIAEKIKVITNGGGTSQPVLDQLASLQAQIDLISSALVYKGTWNASTNTPTLTSSVGTANTFYIVSVAGTTNLNGTSNWGVGDWAVYNGSVWQRIEGGAVGNFTDLSVSGTTTLSGLTASTALALNASKQVVSVTNTGSGNNVLATSPTLVTPVLGTPSSVTLTNATGLPLSTGVTGTLPIANGGTGQTTANTAFNALAPSQTGNSGKYLTTNGTSTSWATVASGTVTSVSGTGTVNGLTLTGTVTTSGSLTLGGTLSGISNASLTNSSITINGTATSLGGSISVGTVTSVAATVPSFLSITGSPITSSGTLAISLSGTALPTTSGGTGLTSFTANGVVYASSSSALTTGSALTFDGSKLVNTGYNKSTYQVSTNTVGTFESVGAAYLSYDSATGASIYSRSNATAENILNLRASTFSFKIGGTQVSSLDSSSFSLYNTPILLSGSTSGYTGFAAPATSNFTIYTLPSSDGTSGQSLVTNGSGTLSWASGTGGTVTSVSGTGTVSGISLSGTVTSSGNLTLGGALDLSAYGGAGAFTTISASSSVTLSGGTANGVAYLNGSKVVTSGSALTFNGTAFINKPTSDSNPVVARFGVINSAATDDAYLDISADAANNLVTLDSTGNNTGSLAFKLGGSEQMRLTSTGLGIGTTSPIAPLHVYRASSSSVRIDTDASASTTQLNFAIAGTNKWSLYRPTSSNDLRLFDNATAIDVMTWQVGGNVGIGTSSPTSKFVVSNSGAAGFEINPIGSASSPAIYSYNRNTSAYGILTSISSEARWQTGSSPTETMRLDSSGNLGIGTSSPSFRLDVQAPTGVIKLTATTGTNASYFRADNTGGILYFGLDDSVASTFGTAGAYGTVIQRPASTAFNINRAGTVDMYINTTGNVGIGTSSPQTKLHVAQSASGVLFGQDSTTANIIGTNAAGTSSQGLFLKGFPLTFTGSGGGGTAQMTLNGDGNLGLGVTPSAWGGKAFQIGNASNSGWASIGYDANGKGFFATSAFNNTGSSWVYTATGWAATLYSADFGTHKWFTAPSGTAGNAITFTQAMTLTAGGGLLVGSTSTPASGSSTILAANSGGGGVQLAHVGSGGGALFVGLGGGGVITYTYTGAVGSESYTERARITSGGFFKASNSGGYVSSTGSFHELRGDVADEYVVRATNLNASPAAAVISLLSFTASAPNNTSAWFLDCTDNSARRAYILSNGGLANYAANNVILSDRREKTNFAPATSYLAKICAIPVQTFNYIDQNLEEDGGLTLGVVAQDVQAVAPELVSEGNWGSKEDPKMRLEIYQTDLQYALMKCIQEQQEIINSLKARLDAANL